MGADDQQPRIIKNLVLFPLESVLLTLFLAAGLLTIGVRVFRQIKRAAKG
jgi:hypothetical protein